MKAIQITMDEALLQRLDETEEVKREGRSAVLRRATSEYLERRRAALIRERYEKAYGSGGEADLGEEYEGWAEQGSWPEE
ncbi:MAG: hypothetical protein ACOC8K_08765 [Gemmatimonadota bacterium]